MSEVYDSERREDGKCLNCGFDFCRCETLDRILDHNLHFSNFVEDYQMESIFDEALHGDDFTYYIQRAIDRGLVNQLTYISGNSQRKMYFNPGRMEIRTAKATMGSD
jgi:hypothetical protein